MTLSIDVTSTVYAPVNWQGKCGDNNQGLVFGIETRDYEDPNDLGSYCEVIDVNWFNDESVRDYELLKLKGDWVVMSNKSPLCFSDNTLNGVYRSEFVLILTKSNEVHVARNRHAPEAVEPNTWYLANSPKHVADVDVIAWKPLDENTFTSKDCSEENLKNIYADLLLIDDVTGISKLNFIYLQSAAYEHANAHNWDNDDWDTWIAISDKDGVDYDLNLYADDENESPIVSGYCYRLKDNGNGTFSPNTMSGYFPLFNDFVPVDKNQIPF